MRHWFLSHRIVAVTAAAIVLPPLLSALLELLLPAVVSVAAALVLVVLVLAIAAAGHRTSGVIASVGAALSFDFFLTAPYHHFAISDRADLQVAVALLVVGVAVTEIATRARRHRVTATIDERYLDAIAETTSLVAAGSDPLAVVARVTGQLVTLFDGAPCTFDGITFGGLPRLSADGTVDFDGGRWDVREFGLPTVGVEVPATCKGSTYGRFLVEPRSLAVVPPQTARVVVILAGQAGAALAASGVAPAAVRAPHA